MIEHKLPKGKPNFSYEKRLEQSNSRWDNCGVEVSFTLKILVYVRDKDEELGCLCDVYIIGQKQELKRKVFKYFSGWWKTEKPSVYVYPKCEQYCRNKNKNYCSKNFCLESIVRLLNDWSIISLYAVASGVKITKLTRKNLLNDGILNIDGNPFIGA